MNNHPTHDTHEDDFDLVETWLQFDFPRLIAGAMAGVFAGLVAAAFGGVLYVMSGDEFWVPLKLAASPILGNHAFNYGMGSSVIVGLIVHCALSGLLGMVYSHFIKTNKMLALLGAGFMWGTFSWVFIQNLFARSFLDVRVAEIPSGPAFIVLLVFGFSLASIKIFDRIICGKTR